MERKDLNRDIEAKMSPLFYSANLSYNSGHIGQYDLVTTSINKNDSRLHQSSNRH